MSRPGVGDLGEPAADTSFTVTLGLPPSANATYLTSPDGGRAKTGSAWRFRDRVRRQLGRACAVDAEAAAVAELLRHGSWWAVYIDVYVKTPLRRDLDNVLKPSVDAIAHALGISDSRLVDIHLSKYLDAQRPRMIVTVLALVDWQLDHAEFLVQPHARGAFRAPAAG